SLEPRSCRRDPAQRRQSHAPRRDPARGGGCGALGRCRGAEPRARRRLHADRPCPGACARVRRHSVEHRGGAPAHGRARGGDRAAGHRGAGLVRCRRCADTAAARIGVRRRALELRRAGPDRCRCAGDAAIFGAAQHSPARGLDAVTMNTRLDSVRGERRALAGLSAAGVAMLIFVALGPSIIRTAGYQAFIPALAASGLLTLAAARLADDVPARSGLVVILGLALAMRLLLIGEQPYLSNDIYRYVWDGRVQAAGINPYLHVPVDPALAALRDTAIFPFINRADYAVTAYPPVAQMFFLLVTRIAESLTIMRLAMVACEFAIVAIVIDLARTLQRPVTAVVAYAWHPLAIWEIANSGHVEALMVALLMLALWLLVRARPVAGVVAAALA